MHADKPMQGHDLMQAITRVTRRQREEFEGAIATLSEKPAKSSLKMVNLGHK